MRYAFSIVVLFAVALVGCINTEDEPKYATATSYCTGWAQAECSDDVIANCALTSKDTCVVKREAICQQEQIPAGKTYDSSKANECIEKVADAYADATLTKTEIQTYKQACGLVFSGTGVKDASCSVNLDCRQNDGLACVIHATGGTCQAAKSTAGGESCADAEAQCQEDFHCGATSHCDANGGSSELCSTALPCKTAYKCGTGGTCESKLANGVICTSSVECTSGICNAGLCVPQIVFSQSEPFCVAARS